MEKEINAIREMISWCEARQREVGIYTGPYQRVKEGLEVDLKRLTKN